MISSQALPPFSLSAMQNPDRHLIGYWIFVGRWAHSGASQSDAPAMALPHGEDFQDFDWSMVRGMPILLKRTSIFPPYRERDFVRHLIADHGAQTVVAVDHGEVETYRAGVERIRDERVDRWLASG